MRITQQLFEIIQESLPQWFVPGETSADLSTQFAAFSPSAALSGGGSVWGQVSSRAVPPERKLIVISPNRLKQASYNELQAIHVMACFCQRAGFAVLIPIENELEVYGMQLFDRQKIAKTRKHTAAALYQLSYEKTKKSANQVFLLDDKSIIGIDDIRRLERYKPRSFGEVYVDTVNTDEVIFEEAGVVHLGHVYLPDRSPELHRAMLSLDRKLSGENLVFFKKLPDWARYNLNEHQKLLLPLVDKGVSVRLLFLLAKKFGWRHMSIPPGNKGLATLLDECRYTTLDDFLRDWEAGKNTSYPLDYFSKKLVGELIRGRWRERQRVKRGPLDEGASCDNFYHLSIDLTVSKEDVKRFTRYTKQIQVLDVNSMHSVFLEESTDFSSLQQLRCNWLAGRLAINAPLLYEMHVSLKSKKTTLVSLDAAQENHIIVLTEKPYLSKVLFEAESHFYGEGFSCITFESGINTNLIEVEVKGFSLSIEWLLPLLDVSPNLKKLILGALDFNCRDEIERLKKRFPLLEVKFRYYNKPTQEYHEVEPVLERAGEESGVYQVLDSQQSYRVQEKTPLFKCVEKLFNWEPFKKIKDTTTGKLAVYDTKEAALAAMGTFRFHESVYEKYQIMLRLQDLVFNTPLVEIKSKSQLFEKLAVLKALLEDAKTRLEEMGQAYNGLGFFKTKKRFYGDVIQSIADVAQVMTGLRRSLFEVGVSGDEKNGELVYAGSDELEVDFDTQHNPKKEYVMKAVCRHITTSKPNRFPYTRLGVYELNARDELSEVRHIAKTPYFLAANSESLPVDESCDFYMFQDAISLIEEQVYRLRSLSARDELFQLKLDEKSVTPADVEIFKDDLGVFYIKAKRLLSGKLQYVMNVPLPTTQEASDVPVLLREVIAHIKSFPSSGSESLVDIAESAPSQEKWEAMYRQKKGACRHRAAIFLYKLNQLSLESPEVYREIKARAVRRGGAHVNVELSFDGGRTYEVLELGGYEVQQRYAASEDAFYESPSMLPPICFSAKQERSKDAPKMSFLERTDWINSSASYGANTLFCIDKIKEIDNCLLYLRAQSPRPIFYVETAAQLRTELENFKLMSDRKTCDIEHSPSGLLYRFLIQHQESDPPPIILINWENFTFEEIIQCNAAINIQHRLVDNTALPSRATVVGFHSKQEKLNDLLQDQSFVSRHVNGGIHDLSEIPAIPALESDADPSVAVPEAIQLHQSSCWYDLLIGKVVVKGGGYEWQEGALLKKLRDPRVSEIQLVNPPLNDAGFLHFVAELRAGQPIAVLDQLLPSRPLTIRVVKNQTVPVNTQLILRRCKHLPGDVFIINAATFEQCLHSKEVTPDGLMFSKMGLLEKYQNRTLRLCVSGNMSYSQWSLLLGYAKEYRVTLEISLAEEVTLPEQFKMYDSDIVVEELISPNLFITSDDVEFSVLKQQKLHKSAIVIDFSELGIDDLFGKILPPKKTPAGFIFEKQPGYVLDALMRGDSVILKGYCSPGMLNYLATLFSSSPYFMVDGEKCSLPGKLIVVTENTVKTPGWLMVRKEEVGAAEKFAELRVGDLGDYEEKSLMQLQQDQKIKKTPVLAIPPLPSEDDFSLEACVAFEKRRMLEVKQVWSFSPVAVLEGPPGSGKSYFVRELQKDPHIKIYYEHEIEKWATEIVAPQVKKVLFRDEINLRKTDCSQDRDLFNNPPSVFVNGKYIPIVGDCCVLSAQNPIDYGGGRREPQLFRDLPACKINFDLMSPAMIVHRILKPIFQTVFDPEESETFAKRLLIENPGVRSVRDLQSKAVFECALEVERRWAVANGVAVAARPKNPRMICLGHGDFIVTPSRCAAYHDLLDLLHVRKFKRSLSDTAPSEAKYGGVNGFILRGPAGVGKSEFIESVLKEEGYRKGDIDTDDFMLSVDKLYFRLSAKKIATMTNDEITLLMGNAFHAGVILLVDEIDSCRLLEKYLNAYLSGENVDGKRPAKAGFTLLCTGNGAAMKGRRQLPQPLLSRMRVHEFSEYTREELIDLLNVKFVSPIVPVAASVLEDAEARQLKAEMITFMVDGFLMEKKTNVTVSPTFRELYAVAENYFKQFSRYLSLGLTRVQHEFFLVYRNHPQLEFLLREFESRPGFKGLSVLEMEKCLLKRVGVSGVLFEKQNMSEAAVPEGQQKSDFLKRK